MQRMRMADGISDRLIFTAVVIISIVVVVYFLSR